MTKNISSEVFPLKSVEDILAMKKSLHGRDLYLFTIGINTSLRISDIIELKFSDFTEDYLLIKENKTSKVKRVRLNQSVKDAVASLRALNSDSEYLFPNSKGTSHITRQTAWNAIKKASVRAGISYNIGTHSMRKTFGYHAYKNGTDITLLMKLFNHSSASITLDYIGITQNEIDDVYININL